MPMNKGPKLPARVYCYGCRLTENSELAYEQLRDAHRYRNQLVELELIRRKAVNDGLQALVPGLATLEESIATKVALRDELLNSINQQRAADRRRTPASTEVREKLRDVREKLKILWSERKILRAATFASPEFVALGEVTNNADTVAVKKARGNNQLYWGTYLLVERAMKGRRKGAPPKFKHFEGRGRVGVQIQHGMTVAEAHLGDDDRLTIRPVRNSNFIVVRMRVGARPDKVYISCSVKLHRPLPPNAIIKEVTLVCDRIATRCKWTCQFMVTSADGFDKPVADSGVVALNIGWRQRPDGTVRAAYFLGDDGGTGELLIPEEYYSKLDKSESLKSIRDLNFDTAKLQLFNHISDHFTPDWLREQLETLMLWRSQARLAKVILTWRDKRYMNDEEIYGVMEAWRKQDKHLYEWEANNARNFFNWRKNSYRVFANWLAQRYHTLRIADISWKKMQNKPAADETDEMRLTRSRKRFVSPALLEGILAERLAEIEWVDAFGLTSTCANCEEDSGTPDPEQLMHTCQHCSETYDQDENHCRNLMQETGELAAV